MSLNMIACLILYKCLDYPKILKNFLKRSMTQDYLEAFDILWYIHFLDAFSNLKQFMHFQFILKSYYYYYYFKRFI